jgi:glycosyltransferase involved in cell wall biosynthesis
MSQPFPISVIIGTYNHGRYIASCIESVLAQTYGKCEIIIIDDGSTDNTAEVVKPYQDRVNYHHQQNQGRGASRNAGIRMANHEWIAFLDADDLWEPTKIEKQVAAIVAHPDIDLIVTNACWFDNDRVVKADYFKTMRLFHQQKIERHGTLGIFSEPLYPLFIDENFVNLSSVLVRKKSLYDEGLFDATLPRAQDRDLWLRLSRRYKFAFIDEILTRSRVHSLADGPTTIVPAISRVQLFEKALAFGSEWEKRCEARLRHRVGHCHYDLAHFHFYRENDLKAARKELKLAMSFGYNNATVRAHYVATFFPVGLITALRKLVRAVRGD